MALILSLLSIIVTGTFDKLPPDLASDNFPDIVTKFSIGMLKVNVTSCAVPFSCVETMVGVGSGDTVDSICCLVKPSANGALLGAVDSQPENVAVSGESVEYTKELRKTVKVMLSVVVTLERS